MEIPELSEIATSGQIYWESIPLGERDRRRYAHYSHRGFRLKEPGLYMGIPQNWERFSLGYNNGNGRVSLKYFSSGKGDRWTRESVCAEDGELAMIERCGYKQGTWLDNLLGMSLINRRYEKEPSRRILKRPTFHYRLPRLEILPDEMDNIIKTFPDADAKDLLIELKGLLGNLE